MGKVYNKKRNIIKTTGLGLTSILLVATVASCKKSSDVYSSINRNGIYSQIGDYKVTNYELFENLAWDGTSELNDQIEKAIVSSYFDKVVSGMEDTESDEYKNNHKKYFDDIREAFIIDTYGVSSLDNYFEININDTFITKKQEKLDQLYSDGISLTSDEFDALVKIENKEDKKLADLDYANLSGSQKEVFKQYYIREARKLFAYDKLEEEITKHETDNNKGKGYSETDPKYDHYFSDSKIITKYKDEIYYKNTYANSILIRFNSQDEINQTLKNFGVKLYNSNYYLIYQTGAHVGKDYEGADEAGNKNLTDAEYSKWYDDYDFTSPSNIQFENATKLDEAQVLALFIEMYNYIYPYKTQLESPVTGDRSTENRVKVTEKLADKSLELDYDKLVATLNEKNFGEVNHSGEKLAKVNASLRTMLYSDLEDKEYSTSGTSNGDYYFMAYKFSVDESKLNKDGKDLTLYYYADNNGDLEQKDPADSSKKRKVDSTKLDRTSNTELIDEIIAMLKDDTLVSTYIDTKINDAKKDAKISIYDDNLSIAYSVSYSDYYNKTSGKAPSDDIIAKVEYNKETTEIKTSELFKTLECENGLSASVDMLTKKIIKNTKAYADTEKDVDKYYTQLNNTLTSFANDGLSSYGYASSIGKYKFLKTYFHTSNVEEIINDVYRVNNASAKLLNDYSSDTALINLLTNYAAQAYDNSFTVSATNLLFYVDQDEDGNPDLNFDWNTKVKINGAETGETYAELAKELIAHVTKLLRNATGTYKEMLSTIVSEYKASGRFLSGHEVYDENDKSYNPITNEKYYAKFKRAGLYLSTEDLSSINNASDESTVALEVKNELYNIYNRNDFKLNGSAPSEYLDSLPYEGEAKGILSNKGYNMLTVTSAEINASAKFEKTSDTNNIYTNLYYYYNEKLTKIDSLYNDSDKLNSAQVQAYILEYADHSTSKTIPSDISSAISSFLSPVYTKYTSTATQREILTSWCEKKTGDTFKFTNPFDETDQYTFKDGSVKETYSLRFEKIRKINQNSADSYSSVKEFEHTSVYNDWWKELSDYIKTITVTED
ncbi:MAG: hypothetical protein K6G28_06995 [Acholeplasmatales bacterium]|nr:hypothetical protein [Acholeplasmatales bacterium]